MRPTAAVAPDSPPLAPDHTQLPDKDGSVVTNFQEHPQSTLFTQCLWPRLEQLYGDEFCVGRDCGIYWRSTQPPLNGCKSPDWSLVPGVPKLLDGQVRRSYVLWHEVIKPLLVIEYVSGDGSEERDRTPFTGKFWVYERGISAGFYAIFDGWRSTLEVFGQTASGTYAPVAPNAAGRFPVEPLGIELGLWQGVFDGMDVVWLRAWDAETGRMLPSLQEREAAERERAEAAEALIDDANRMRDDETERAEAERKRADKAEERAAAAEEARQKLLAKLRDLGIDPDQA